jgi:hypothetical protein
LLDLLSDSSRSHRHTEGAGMSETEPPAEPTESVIDLRAWKRFTSAARTPVRLLVQPDLRTLTARVLDASVGGLGLLFEGPLEPGSVLSLLLLRPDHGWVPRLRASRIVTAKVAHATPHPDGWRVGCRLASPLDEAELEALTG